MMTLEQKIDYISKYNYLMGKDKKILENRLKIMRKSKHTYESLDVVDYLYNRVYELQVRNSINSLLRG
jgi:hypothetical protein